MEFSGLRCQKSSTYL